MKNKKTAHDQPGTPHRYVANFTWSSSDGSRYTSHTAVKGRTPREGEARLRSTFFATLAPEVA